jgi:hypothetical protein
MAERILMNEFKALSQEKWVSIEVSLDLKVTSTEDKLADRVL